jgi:hypothetical protein
VLFGAVGTDMAAALGVTFGACGLALRAFWAVVSVAILPGLLMLRQLAAMAAPLFSVGSEYITPVAQALGSIVGVGRTAVQVGLHNE